MATTLTFYDGYDDERALQLREDGVNLTQSAYQALTNVELLCKSSGGTVTTLESDTAAHKITIDDANQQIVLELGLAAALEVGSYDVRVIGYTSADPSGLMYADYGELQIIKKA